MAQKSISVLLTAVTGPYQAAMARAAGTTRGFSTAAQGAATQVSQVGKQAGLVSPKLLGAAGLAFGIKSVADAAVDWESSMAGVMKTVEGTPEQIQGINDGLRDMSKEIPTSAGELASIAESAGQLGIQTDNVLDFTKVIADLGETTNLAGQQGATELARFANITGMAQDDFDRLGSSIVELGNNFATTEAEISEMALRIAGAGAQIGLSEGDILGISTALSSVGIRAQAGGSAISKVMIDISSQVENSGDKLALFAETAGMSAEQFSEAWREDAAGALVEFISGLGDMEESGGSTLQVLEELEITEVRMRDALLRAAGAGDLLSDAIGTGNDAFEENNALQEEAALRYETTEAKIQTAKNAFTDLKVELGEGLLPVLGEAATAFNELLGFEIPGASGIDMGDALVGGLRGLVDLQGQSDMIVNKILENQDKVDAAAANEASQMTDAEKRVREHIAALDDIPGAAGEAGGAVGDLGDDMDETAGQTDGATSSLEVYEDALKRSTDPVFNLTSALEDVDAAQEAYTEAVDKHGPKSEEARSAALNLAQAVSGAELAAINGDLSFSAFEDKLDQWVDMGVITADQASTMRARVKELRDESERYEGNYNATVGLSGYGNTLAQLERLARAADRVGDDIHVAVSGTTIGGRTAGSRAQGGPVNTGRPYLVGEEGPELVTFGQSGYVHDANSTEQMLGTTHMSASGAGVQPINVHTTVVSELDGYRIGISESTQRGIRAGAREHSRDTAA